jgi:hypothetical protein
MTKKLFQDKNAIYKRLVRLAAELWGLKERNIDAHDPVIGLIFTAVAEELSKIGTEISEIRQGLVDEISSALLPRELNGAKPAHGILHMYPTDMSVNITKTHQFTSIISVTNSSNGRQIEKPIYLTPVDSFTIHPISVQRIITPTGMLEWRESSFELNEYARVKSSQDSLIIGITVSDQIDFIDKINLFFYNEDFINLQELNDETNQLRAGIGKHDLTMKPGLTSNSTSISAIKSLINVAQHQEQEIIEHYRSFYREIVCNLNKRNWQESSNLLINQLFEQEATELGLNKFLWIELVTSNPTKNNLINQIRCQTNCVPVFNRRNREISHRMNNFFNIINLPGEDQFYDIEEVSSSHGNKYTSVNQLQSEGDLSFGTYEVRHHRTGRIDEDEVISKLNYLIELLRDESSAFSALDLNFLSVHLRTLDQNIEQLRNKIPQSQLISNNNYLILQSKQENDTVFVKFWTTEGLHGNHLNTNSEISPFENYDIVQSSIRLVVDMSMGRDKLNSSERLRLLQWQLTSKDSIYSKEDIVRFCLAKSSKIKEVQIKYKMHQMPDSNKGFQKVLNVELATVSAQNFENKDKERLKLEIQKNIENKSLISFPILVTWKN